MYYTALSTLSKFIYYKPKPPNGSYIVCMVLEMCSILAYDLVDSNAHGSQHILLGYWKVHPSAYMLYKQSQEQPFLTIRKINKQVYII